MGNVGDAGYLIRISNHHCLVSAAMQIFCHPETVNTSKPKLRGQLKRDGESNI